MDQSPFQDTEKKATEKHEQSQTHQDALVKAEMAKEAERRGSNKSQQLEDKKRPTNLETRWF